MSIWPRQSWSQMGEDLILENLLNERGIKPNEVVYLEVGTNDPCDSNNTYLFYKHGATGVLVEPDEMYWGRIENHRPKDQLMKVCVGDFEKEADFYIMSARSLNTLLHDVAKNVEQSPGYGNQKIEKVVKIPVLHINTVISKMSELPNLLSVDTEGMDYRILSAVDWKKYPIKIVCVEAGADRSAITTLMQNNGYRLLCDNNLNMMFGRE